MNWKVWFHSLAAAAIGGGSSALLGALAMPDTFNFSHEGWIHLGKLGLIGMLIPVLTLLKQSPLPEAVITQTQTVTNTTKLGAWALIAILLGFTIPEMGCSGQQVARNIVDWTPALVSAVNTVGGAAVILDPASAPILALAITGFDAAAKLVQNQAQAYLDNPNATILQQLQAAVISFQQQVTQGLLTAARIVNPQSQATALLDINAVATVINTILGLIAGIKGNTVAATSAAVKLSMVQPYLNRDQSIEMLSAHYGESRTVASVQYDGGLKLLTQVGF
jgi:hypothetical protein